MTKDYIYNTIKDIIATTFSINKDKIRLQTSSDDIEEWDSLGHIRLILQIESIFKIKFNTIRISKLNSINALVEEIKQNERFS